MRKNYIIGIACIAAAILMLLGNLGILAYDGNILFSVAMTVGLGYLIYWGTSAKMWSIAGVSVAWLFHYWNGQLWHVPLDWWTTTLCGFLFGLGLQFLLSRRSVWDDENTSKNATFVWSFDSEDSQISDNSVNVLFGSRSIHLTSEKLKDNATLSISCFFGEITIYVPKEYRVENRSSVLFGEFYVVPRSESASKTLITTGAVAFGEVKVVYV